jgi:DNA segregation ATPase FtsK/SpoIIIE-like protein
LENRRRFLSKAKKLAQAYETAQEAIRKEEKNIEKGMNEIKKDFENVIPIKQATKPKISIDEKKKPEPKLEMPFEGKQEETKPMRIGGIDGPPIVLAPVKNEKLCRPCLSAIRLLPTNMKEKKVSNYKLPSADLLTAPENQELEINRDELLEKTRVFWNKNFVTSVSTVKVVEVQPGPVVTMYEFEPASGVKVNQVTKLNDDLTMALKAMSVRISLVPGKSVIGIEVANRNRQIVYLKDIIADSIFKR